MTPDLFTQPLEEARQFAQDAIRQQLKAAKAAAHPYHNSVPEHGETLATYRAKAAKQDAEVLDVIDRLGGSAAPSTVWIAMGKRCPITSCRRAMTNLTNAGKLVKTEGRHAGEFGRAEGIWKLAVQCATP